MDKTDKLAGLLEQAQSRCEDLDLSLGSLNPNQPQSLDNDFSEPLVVCEDLMKLLNELMEMTDE